jgi:hypothetical protein
VALSDCVCHQLLIGRKSYAQTTQSTASLLQNVACRPLEVPEYYADNGKPYSGLSSTRDALYYVPALHRVPALRN